MLCEGRRGKARRVQSIFFLAPKLALTTRGHSPRVPETVKYESTTKNEHILLLTRASYHEHKAKMSSSPAPEPEPEPTQPAEEAKGVDEDMGDSTLPRPEAGTDDETGQNDGEHPDEAGNAVGPANTTTPDSAGGKAESSLPLDAEPSNVAQVPPPQSTGASSEQFFADMSYNKNRSQQQEYPTTHEEGGGDGEEEKHVDQQQQEHQFEGTIDGSPASPAGFGIEDDAAQQSARGGAEGFDAGGHGGGELENDAMYPSTSQDLPGRYLGNSDGRNDGDDHAGGMEARKGFGESGQDTKDDSESRSRRMFDGSRVAEPDDLQIVDAGEGADIIPGVDDLPVFANDQSKALNDETKVRQGRR